MVVGRDAGSAAGRLAIAVGAGGFAETTGATGLAAGDRIDMGNDPGNDPGNDLGNDNCGAAVGKGFAVTEVLTATAAELGFRPAFAGGDCASTALTAVAGGDGSSNAAARAPLRARINPCSKSR